MSYAIVRNENLTRTEINRKGTHNDRKTKNHNEIEKIGILIIKK